MNYEMGGTILSKTVKEKDLGVTMNASMKVSEQCRIAASKGSSIIVIIFTSVHSVLFFVTPSPPPKSVLSKC